MKIKLFIFCLIFTFSLPSFAKTKSEGGVFPDLTYLVLQGDYDNAQKLANSSSAKKLKNPYQDRLTFIQAYLALKSKDFSKSEKLFTELQKNYPALQNYTRYYLAQSLRGAGKPDQAISILEDLQSSGSASSYLKGFVKKELALTQCQSKKPEQGVKLFQEMVQQESAPHALYHLRFEQAQCLVAAKQNQQAAAILKGLYLDQPEGDLSVEILQALRGIDSSLTSSEYVNRGEQLLLKNRPDLAAIDFEYAVNGTAVSAEMREKLATTYFKARRYAEAAEQYEKLRHEFPESFSQTEDLPQLAKAYSRSDQWGKAIAIYREELISNPNVDVADTRYKIAYLEMDQGDLKKANEEFSNLLTQFPSHPKKNQIDWFLAWNDYSLGNFRESERRFSSIANSSSNATQLRAKYWRARSLEEQGDKANADQIYREITAEEPFSYYGFVSLKRLESHADAKTPPHGGFARELPDIHSPRLFSFTDLKKSDSTLKELLSVGLWENLMGEWKTRTYRDSFFQVFLEEDFVNYPSSSNDLSDEGWQQRYPAAYPLLISFFAESRQIPIPLAWSIMREESHFRPEVVSPAQAIGLMQMIPPTGLQVAQSMQRTHFLPEDLFQPNVNLEYGVHYLATNYNRFGQHLIPTIASYNAGEQAVERWKRSHPDLEWDEFVEEIPYAETQEYVRKVLKSYYIYQLMYF